MKKTVFSICAFAALTILSCTKDKTEKPDTTLASLQGNWVVTKIVTVEEGMDPYTYEGKTGDHYNFGTGTVEVKVDEYEVTVPYERTDATHVQIGDDLQEIKELSSHKLVLHSPATAEVPEDQTFTLTR